MERMHEHYGVRGGAFFVELFLRANLPLDLRKKAGLAI